MTMRILSAEFAKGVNHIDDLQLMPRPEIAVIGRSNVGKSSFINNLTQRRNLARSSATPGCTKELNYYALEVECGRAGKKRFFLVDLPGFGYAKLSKEDRKALNRTIDCYLLSSKELRCVCLLNDCRRFPENEELYFRDQAFELGKPVLTVLTKCDKLSRNELNRQRLIISKCYGLEPGDLLLSSKNETIEGMWERLIVLI